MQLCCKRPEFRLILTFEAPRKDAVEAWKNKHFYDLIVPKLSLCPLPHDT